MFHSKLRWVPAFIVPAIDLTPNSTFRIHHTVQRPLSLLTPTIHRRAMGEFRCIGKAGSQTSRMHSI